MAVTTDKVVVELQAKLAKYQSDIASNQRMFSTKMVEMERAAQRMEQRTSASFGRTGGMLKNLFAGGAAGLSVGALAAFARSAVKSLGDIADNAVRAGLSIKEMQRVTFAFVSEGGNAGDAVSIFQKFNKEIADAVSKGGDLADILKANNVPLKDMQGNVRSNVDLFAQVLDLIKNAKNETDRQLLAQLATGRSANEFLQIMAAGGNGFKKLGDEAERVGYVIDEKLIKSADEFDTAWNKAWETFSVNAKSSVIEIGNELRILGRLLSGDNLQRGSPASSQRSGDMQFLSPTEQQIHDILDRLERLRKARDNYAKGLANPGSTPQQKDMLGRVIGDVDKQIADAQKLLKIQNDINDEVRPPPNPVAKPSAISDAITAAEEAKGAAKELEAADKLAESLEKKAADNVRQLAEATDMLFAATRREIEMRKLEAASVGKSVYEHERLRKQMELMNALEDAHRQNGGAVTPEEVQRVNDLADNYGKVAQAISDNQKALDELRSYTDVVFSDMESALDNFIDTGKLSFKDLALSIIRDMAKTGIHNLLNGAKDGSPGSGGGGIVGWLSSLMGGGKDKGSASPSQDSSPSSPSQAAAPSAGGGGGTEQEIWNFWKGKGMTDAQVSGIMGNISAESGYNPSAVGDNGNAYGLYQHNGPRRRALFDFAGTQNPTVAQQNEFAHRELMSSEAGAYRGLMGATDHASAAQSFGSLFERPADLSSSIAARTAAAAAASAKFAGTGAIAAPATAGAGDIGGLLSSLLSLFGGARARGGPAERGKAYVVGEKGPELFSPSQSGFVVPNIMNKMPGNENAAGNNAQFHVNVTKSKYFDVHISRQVNAGNTRTLDMARRQMPDTQARFNKLGTTSR